jgi:CTP synthase (UTP-ammonia lyase)
MKATRIAIIGEFSPAFPPHAATNVACEISAAQLGGDFDWTWVSTADVSERTVEEVSGIWIAPGSPYKSLGNTLAVIRAARERRVPTLGTCGGCQHIILEYAKHVLGFQDAMHAEYDPYASNLFVSQLECSLVGRALPLRFKPGSRIAAIYGAETSVEEYYCNFGVNPDKIDVLASGELRITGSDAEGEVRVVELPEHPFYLGTLFVPQMRSTAERPHPVVNAFFAACQARMSVEAV